MKALGTLLVVTLLTASAIAQSDGGQPSSTTDEVPADQPHVASVRVLSTAGEEEVVRIRISGRNANAFSEMAFDIPEMRAAAFPMKKAFGSDGNGDGNGTSVWTVSVDLDKYADAGGDVTVELRPSCCFIPGAIVVRSKGR
jgi:hypothetical protein